ncbi:MAG: SLBB domain-containing protein, partial [Thermodesulfovibrionia bacterium]|nr:SLBB domain-containing protein [Thermodesulfovibrionia bacterium]
HVNMTYAKQIQIVPISPEATSLAQKQIPVQEKIDAFLESQKADKESGQPSETEQAPPSAHSTEKVETLSEFEQFITGRVPATVSTNIRQFGYDLFRIPPTSFAPDINVPVGPGYVLGPGDEIHITIWGKVEGSWNVVIDRDGNISLPKVGIIGVTGFTFSEIKNLLYKEFSKYYTSFEMNLSMGALRTIRVYVVGNALRPGAYTISSLSTLVNALFEAGGPGKSGTMRDIQLKRSGETIRHFDMYDFLLKGDKTKDIRLMPEDVIFIPSAGPLAGIAGNVNRPAIYELKDETRLLDLINMADGLTSVAFKGRVQWQRIEDHQYRTVFEGDLFNLESDEEKNFILKDGDLVKIFPVIETNNTIILTGAVANEGEYGIIAGATKLRDVISKAGGVLYYASEDAELTRTKITQSGTQTDYLYINIPKAMNGDPGHDISLEINDYIFIKSVPEWQLYKKVNISGQVKHPGQYTIKKGEALSSLIKRAGGYSDRAFLRGAVFIRGNVREMQQKSIDVMVERLERELLAEGSIQISSALSKEEIEAKKVELDHQQKFISSLNDLKATGRMSIRIAHLRLLKNSEYDLELEEGDSLFIPVKSSVVNVTGAIMSRGSFIYSENNDYKDYIRMAGGFAKYADEKSVYVLKVDGTAMKLPNGMSSWSDSRERWELNAFNEEIKTIEPGDSIIVPEKLDRIAWLREIKDLTQIIYQIAITAGVAIVVF